MSPQPRTAHKPAPKGAGSRAKARAAVSERNGTPRSIVFRGETLNLPATLPGSLYFDFADLAEDEGNPATHVRLLTSLIGADQVAKVREKVIADSVSFDEMGQVFMDLLSDAMSAYGMTTGESSASAGS